jgi:BlaI family penicillinase repressor
MRKKIPQISEAEAIVMEVLWSEHPLTAEQVVHTLGTTRQWRGPTIKTLLGRLLNKGAVVAQVDGRRYLYSPILQRDQWQVAESNGFVERVFGGRVGPLVAHLAQHRKLTQADLKQLRKLVEGMDDER